MSDEPAYQRPSTDWLAALRFGIAIHWTALSRPVSGEPLTFDQAVDEFDAQRFVARIADCGAQHLLFTTTHALQQLPAPCESIDAILPARTTRRDLIGDLADACIARGLRFLLYYNHSCNGQDDTTWANAVGYYGPDFDRFAGNICAIVGELSERYAERVSAWWFDSAYALDPRGPENTVTAELNGFQFPWPSMTAAAKRGNPNRLVCYNPGAWPPKWKFMYTQHQDYLPGEANDLIEVPTGRYHANGLQNHRWVCLDNADWVHSRPNTPLASARYSAEQLRAYVSAAHACHTPVTFNIDIDQRGEVLEDTLALLATI